MISLPNKSQFWERGRDKIKSIDHKQFPALQDVENKNETVSVIVKIIFKKSGKALTRLSLMLHHNRKKNIISPIFIFTL